MGRLVERLERQLDLALIGLVWDSWKQLSQGLLSMNVTVLYK